MKHQRDAEAIMLYDPFVEDLPVIQRLEELPAEETSRSTNDSPKELRAQQVEEPAEEDCPSVQVLATTITQVEVVVEKVNAAAGPREQPAEPPADEIPLPRDKKPQITQVEAMRRALTDLGLEAKNADLADYLRSHFGLAPKNIAVLKSTAKKTLVKKGASEVQPEIPHPELAAATNGEAQITMPLEPLPPVENALIQPESALLATVVDPQSVILQVESTEEPTINTDAQPSQEEMAESIVFDLEDVATVKGLCDRLGRDALLELLDLLSQ